MYELLTVMLFRNDAKSLIGISTTGITQMRLVSGLFYSPSVWLWEKQKKLARFFTK